ncbi:MAG: M50 family metallopeptidase [Oscillospiraceae bacterium]|nr:M50 family metallopeptidase [Oscillospiraceae bacterium]
MTVMLDSNILFLAAASESEAFPLEVILSILVMVAALYVGFVVHAIVHEAGHLVAGKLSGYDFLSFRIFKIVFVKKDGKMQRKKYTVAGTGGQCLMSPPDYKDNNYPFVFYNLGGSLMNFALGAIFFVLMSVTSGYAATAFAGLGLVGAVIAAMNIIPMKIGGMPNDGYNTMLCVKNEGSRLALWVHLRYIVLLSQGVRVRDMPEDWFATIDANNISCPLSAMAAFMRYCYLTDIGTYAEACEYARYLLDNGEKLLEVQKNELRCELMFFELVGVCRMIEIEELYNDKLQKYVKATLTYMSRQRLMYAYNKFYLRDDAKAQKSLADFEKAASHTPFAGEIAGEREMLALATGR